MDEPGQPQPQPYRLGYREGFRDGFGEADRQSKEAKEDEKKKGGKDGDGGDTEGGEKKDDDAKSDDKGKDDEKKDEGGKDKKPLYKRPFLVAGLLLLVLVLLLVAILFWRHSKHHQTTDDAFVDGHASTVAAQTAGRVTKLYVTDNQHVNAGDPLVDIDPRDTDARLAQAKAQLATAQGQYEQAQAQLPIQRANAAEADANTRQAEADLTKAIQDLGRYRAVNPDAVPRQQVDQVVAAEKQARAKRDAAAQSARAAHAQIESALAQVRANVAQIDAAKAQVDAAQVQGTYNHVVAPIAGRVARRTVEAGNVVATGAPMMALVGDELWVTANYKETQLTEMKPGQSVEIVVDAYPDVTFRGHVDSIQRATGAYFSMLPAENATGNYVKVVQRVPVKIVFDDDRVRDYVIGPGMSATPDVTLP